MKAGPVFAMVGLVLLGMWLVLQPTLSRGEHDFALRVGAVEMLVTTPEAGSYAFVEPPRLAELGVVDTETFNRVVAEEQAAWEGRPAFERKLLGFFNITNWVNFTWVAVGLLGQGAFFGRMMIQWVVSEKSRQSQVPELFWWLSLFGGVSLFTYFVWRTDVVGVLGQSTGVVVYARNLRLIKKKKRRDRRQAQAEAQAGGPATQNTTSDANATDSPELATAGSQSDAGLPR